MLILFTTHIFPEVAILAYFFSPEKKNRNITLPLNITLTEIYFK